ncbi:hypothetical protein [Brevibacillus laterosporus]
MVKGLASSHRLPVYNLQRLHTSEDDKEEEKTKTAPPPRKTP